MNKQNISFTLGERLKDLREKRGLSHDKLKKQLNEKYGISVSRDSLMAYEISDETRAKASKFPNLGMRVEYLYCLADFYGVSLDYLLGKTDVAVQDMDIRWICEKTGLSQQVACFLMAKFRSEEFNAFFGGYSPLPYFLEALHGLHVTVDRAKKVCSEFQVDSEENHNALLESKIKMKYARFCFLDEVMQRADGAYEFQQTMLKVNQFVQEYLDAQPPCELLDDEFTDN